MKHASPLALESISRLLSEIRDLPGIAERKTGIFYKSGRAFLHFHEDPTGMFADARIEENDFSRFPVNSEEETAALLKALRNRLT